jgi:hypothetical protein
VSGVPACWACVMSSLSRRTHTSAAGLAGYMDKSSGNSNPAVAASSPVSLYFYIYAASAVGWQAVGFLLRPRRLILLAAYGNVVALLLTLWSLVIPTVSIRAGALPACGRPLPQAAAASWQHWPHDTHAPAGHVHALPHHCMLQRHLGPRHAFDLPRPWYAMYLSAYATAELPGCRASDLLCCTRVLQSRESLSRKMALRSWASLPFSRSCFTCILRSPNALPTCWHACSHSAPARSAPFPTFLPAALPA